MGTHDNLQDDSRDVPLSPSVRQSMPPTCGNRIQGMVGDQEAEFGFRKSLPQEVPRPQ